MPELERIKNGFFNRYPDRITTIDSHTQGEPTRLLVGGVGDLPGPTIKDKKDHFEAHFDHLRQLLTREPRGHRGIMAAVVTEPVSPRGAFGLFYMDARRYPYLCGHATIGAVASLVDVGALAADRWRHDHHGRHPVRAPGCAHPHPQRPGGIRGH
jgi:proline racemase